MGLLGGVKTGAALVAAAARVSERIEPAALAKYRALELRRSTLAVEHHDSTMKLAGMPWNWPDKELRTTLQARLKTINEQLGDIGREQGALLGPRGTFPQAPDFRAALLETGWSGRFH